MRSQGTVFLWARRAATLAVTIVAFFSYLEANAFSAVARKEVMTQFGPVNGYAPDSGSWAWKAVPYAKAPIRALRWKAPVDPVPWSTIRDASVAGSVCVQEVINQYWVPQNMFTGSEDCLFLDIYAPNTTQTNLPVYFFIHGGSNFSGSAKDFDGTALAKRGNMIVVFVQYRLGPFGFLTHPALRQSGTLSDRSGNYGALDQIKALKWVQNNIAAFGGDPTKVTVGGQSAGAHNTMNLLISPMTAGLFRGAFLQSNSMPLYTVAEADSMTTTTLLGLLMRDTPPRTLAQAQGYLAGMTNAQIATYLRCKSASQIMRARRDGTGANGTGNMALHSAIRDGNVIRDATWTDAIAAGNYLKVPSVFGGTRYELKDVLFLYGALIKFMDPTLPSGTHNWYEFLKVIGVGGNLTLDQVLPREIDKSFYQTFVSLLGRQYTTFGTNDVVRALKTKDPTHQVYSYIFEWAGGGDPARADFATLFGAAHAMDLPFFFGASADAWNYSFTNANRPGRDLLQGAMMEYLISFVKTLNPNPSGSGLPNWPVWDNAHGAPKAITFDATLSDKTIGIDTVGEATADTYPDVAAAKIAYAQWLWMFSHFGILPSG